MALLTVEDLEVSYGLIKAIRGVSFEVNKGEIVALIGANGAGKTTIMHSLCNLIPKAKGKVTYDGKDITNIPAHKLVPMGMAQVPEGRRIFCELTVAENLKMGAYTRSDKAEKENTLKEIYTRFPILKERSKQIAGTLSGGEQQMLAIGRALITGGDLLLLDEPSMGIAPKLVLEIFDTIQQIAAKGQTIMLVEQNAMMATDISNYCYVLETGTVAKEGTPEEMKNDDSIVHAYLG